MSDLRKNFEPYRVKANSLEDFISRYYRGDRLQNRGDEYVQAVLASHRRDLERYGYDIISRHESVTGVVVAWWPDDPKQGHETEQMSLFELEAAQDG